MKLPLQNISNYNNSITFFCRKEDGSLDIIKNDSYMSYYYEKTTDKEADAVSLFGEPLRKIYCDRPSDVRKQRSPDAYEADLSFCKRIIVDNVDEIIKSKTRIIFFDIEVTCTELPHPKEDQKAESPISVITIYDNYADKYKTFFIKDYESEFKMLEDFCTTIKKLQPDILCLEENTLVNTNNGQKKIKNIMIGDKIQSWTNYHEFGYSTVIKKYKEKKETIKIITKYGNVEASSEHLFPIASFKDIGYRNTNNFEYKKLSDLKKGDYLLYPRKFINLSKEVDDLFWFIGYYLADGNKGQNRRLSLVDNELELLQYAQNFLKRLNIESTIKKYNNYFLLYSNQNFIAEQIVQKIKNIYDNPEILNNFLPHQQLAIISGLIDGDGTYNTKHLSLAQSNKKIMDWCSQILWAIGIPNVIKKVPKSKLGKATPYILSIYQSEYNSYFNLKSAKKKNFCQLKSFSKEGLPIYNHVRKLLKCWNIELDSELSQKFYGNATNKNISRQLWEQIYLYLIKQKLNIYQLHKINNLNKYLNSFTFSKILNIKKQQLKTVYDIKLDKHHTFVANNILTHNCGFNVDFDYYYLFYRIGENFPKMISPISETQWERGFQYPAGISVVDFQGLYSKYTLFKKDSYALMNVANDELGYEIEEDFDFTDVDIAKEKNIKDVKKLKELNEKLKLFDYFNEIRLISKCLWCDLPAEMRNYQWQSNNSKVIDMLALAEAKKLGVVLPSKKQERNDDEEDYMVEGATRWMDKGGLHLLKSKVDISGAYPNAIISFCLSPENFVNSSEKDTIKINVLSRENREFKNTYYVRQNENAIVPSLVRKLLKLKDDLKEKLNSASKDSEEYKQLEIRYAAMKSLVNTSYGCLVLPFFRLFDFRVGESITFLIRDLLFYIREKLKKENKNAIYGDTDSFLLDGQEDVTEQLNNWALEWAMDKFGNDKVDIRFDYEGFFSSIFIQGLCRYRGRLETKTGQKIECRGIQMKRKDSSKWVKSFQEQLYDKILDGENKENLLKFIKDKIEEMKNVDIREIALPVKINKKLEDYKTTPKWKIPLEETQKIIPEFQQSIGNRFYIIYCKSVEKLALSNKYYEHIKRENIDWDAMLERNVFNILVPIFKGLKYEEDLLKLTEEYSIILGSQYRNTLLEELENKEDLKIKYSAKEVKKRQKEKLPNQSKGSIPKSLKTKKIKIDGSLSSEKIDNTEDTATNLNKETILEELKKRGLK